MSLANELRDIQLKSAMARERELDDTSGDDEFYANVVTQCNSAAENNQPNAFCRSSGNFRQDKRIVARLRAVGVKARIHTICDPMDGDRTYILVDWSGSVSLWERLGSSCCVM